MAAVLAWAVAFGWVGGVLAAVVMTASDLSVRVEPTGTTWGNIFLLFLAAGVVGYSTARLREATEARAQAERTAATMEERARLARVVHDGVLQVLALVQRRGLELGARPPSSVGWRGSRRSHSARSYRATRRRSGPTLRPPAAGWSRRTWSSGSARSPRAP